MNKYKTTSSLYFPQNFAFVGVNCDEAVIVLELIVFFATTIMINDIIIAKEETTNSAIDPQHQPVHDVWLQITQIQLS